MPTSFAMDVAHGPPARIACSRPPALHDGLQVLCHGYIAHRDELARTLLDAGEAREATDARLFAAAYRRWGQAVSAHVLGEYSAALFDPARQALFATHDAIGLRPLYYAERPGGLRVATHLDLMRDPGAPPALSEAYVAQYLTWGQSAGTATIHRGVRLLAAGQCLEATPGRLSLATAWRPDEALMPETTPPEALAEQFLALLDRAVASAAGARTWAELSGGLDSSTVAAVAARQGLPGLATVSAVYPRSASSDEGRWIAAAREGHGLPAHLLDGDAARPFSVLPDRPVAEPCRAVGTWALLRAYERALGAGGADVLLSGLGGDQTLQAQTEPLHLADRLRGGDLGGLLRGLRGWQRADADRRSLLHLFVRFAARPWWRHALGRAQGQPYGAAESCPWLARGFADAHVPRHAPAPGPRLASVGGQYLWERIALVSLSAGQLWNQFTDAFETRHPLLYRPLVSFMLSLPWSLKARPGTDRVLQRQALAGLLPDPIRLRTGKGLLDEALFEGLRASATVGAMLTDRPLVVERGYVDGAAWSEAFARGRVGFVRNNQAFLSTCCLEIWLRQTT